MPEIKTLQQSEGVTVGAVTAVDIGAALRTHTTASSPVAVLTTVETSVASITVTAGDWDVTGLLGLSTTSNPTGTSGGVSFSLNTSVATLGGGSVGDARIDVPFPTTVHSFASSIPALRVSTSSTITYYMVVLATFTGGNMSAFGRISARLVKPV